jgi:ADP-ribose pyrophosphatase YjhB (NUDIX family)
VTASLAPRWLQWAQRLQAIAQDGLTYAENVYDRERYEQLRELAAEIMAAGCDTPLDVIRGLFADQAGYATPKVDVRGAVFREGQVLLVQERSDGLWTLPGGWADPGYTPAENTVREVREESGYEARAIKLALVHDRSRHVVRPHPFYIYKLFFLCELVGGAPQPSIETAAVGFFDADDLPPLSLGRVTPEQLARMFAHWREPSLPTEFD